MESPVNVLRNERIETRHGVLSTRLYRAAEGTVAMALWTGDLRGGTPVLSRLHSSCFTSEGLCGLDCDCVAQLDFAIESIVKEGRGIVFYLLQEGRGAGLPNKARDRSMVQRSAGKVDTYGAYALLGLPPDPRTYDVIRPMCADLGIVAPLRLMTNNPAKISALSTIGLDVLPVEHVLPASRYNAQYIAAKAKFGHLMAPPELCAAALPTDVADNERVGVRFGRFVVAASYWLPIDVAGAPTWFRATSCIDEPSGHDRMILALAASTGLAEVRHVYRDELASRIRGSGPETTRYREALRRIVERGAGSVLAVPADAALMLANDAPSEDDDLELLHAEGISRGAETYEEVA